MEFQPLYYKDKIHIINPRGDVGVVTLWSPVKTVVQKLANLDISLDPHTSRIAALGTLFGNGLPELLRNLLYNPQINHLLLVGKDLSGSSRELQQFFKQGVEPINYLGTALFAIVGTERKIDGAIRPEDFAGRLAITDLSVQRSADIPGLITDFFAALPPAQLCNIPRIERVIPPIEVKWYPSDPRAHTVVADQPLMVWQGLIFRLVRFGHHNTLKKGARIELQNVKAVIQEPVEESAEQLAEHGFSLAELHRYQKTLLDPQPCEDQPYTYGNRLRGYFGPEEARVDALSMAIEHLRDDSEARLAYMALWDTARDSLPGIKGHPCLVSLFFRKFEEKLTLTATFRTHNALDGWLKNVYGLMAIQRHVAEAVALPVGALSLFSHSLTLDPQGNGLERAQAIAAAKMREKPTLRLDPQGEFRVTSDDEAQEIVVQHLYKGQLLKEYRAQKAEDLEHRLACDLALSEISHALYLGREIARTEMRLKRFLLR